MSLPSFVSYGPKFMELAGRRIVRPEDDLDRLVVSYQSDKEEAFKEGFAPPGYANMVIQRVEEEEECRGEAYVSRLECVGLLSLKSHKQLKFHKREVLEGFDEAEATWVSNKPDSLQRGTVHPDYPNLYCVEADKGQKRYGMNFWDVGMRYRGLIGSKPYKRRIRVNEQIVSPSDPITVDMPGGWPSEARKSSVSFPKVVVVDSYVSLEAPPTDAIPGASTPADAPPIQSITITGTNLVYHWPHGWKLADIDSDQIPGCPVWFITLTREFVWAALWG